jgi:multisubunit Na+/H+ antiporter MnhF subunit
MNAWLIAATALLAGLVPCALVCMRERLVDAVVALELVGIVETLVMVLLAEGFERAPFYDLAIVLAVLSFTGSLAFARFLERDI